MRSTQEHILLIGDGEREVQRALGQALPAARITSVPTVFDGIAELSQSGELYTTVLAAAEPIERRPEAAIRTLRDLVHDGRLVLFGDAAHEPLARKMRPAGCDDYLLAPIDPAELRELLGEAPMRLAPAAPPAASAPPDNGRSHGRTGPFTAATSLSDGSATQSSLARIPIADILLDALLHHPHDPMAGLVREINAYLGPAMQLVYRTKEEAVPSAPAGWRVLAHPLNLNDSPNGTLCLIVRPDQDDVTAQAGLAQLANLVDKTLALQDRHTRLQKLAITDELTGVYNARYFRHFLNRIIERARKMHFPVTLLMFDIDDFKKYNDQHGHGVGDEILKQTATLMKRCTREHDLVARIGGDEFAVVFWDKEGPRQPREGHEGSIPGRPPASPEQIFRRFKSMISGAEFTALGQSGQGVLGISAGLAVYPYDAPTPDKLIEEADHALMQGAKRQRGKNCLYIVGTDDPASPPG